MAQPLECGFFVRGDLTTSNDLIDVIGRFANTSFGFQFGVGTGNGNVDVGFVDQRSLNSAANESLDLNGTALDNIFGVDLAMAKMKLLAIWAPAANTTTLTIGNVTNGIVGPLGAATHSFEVKPGGFAVFADPVGGWTITGGTQDLIKVTNGSGAAAIYNSIVLGASA